MGSIHHTNHQALEEILCIYTRKGRILDMTFGQGAFWPNGTEAITLDLYTAADIRGDFYQLPFPPSVFQTVIFDPPYRMSGTTSNYPVTKRYGNISHNYLIVSEHYKAGIREAQRVLKRHGILIVKMQDQVVSGKMYFQTNAMLQWARGLILVDEIHVATGSRPQPKGRIKRHISNEHSTFQVWRKG